MTEFKHYQGCHHNDPDNCSGCALTTGGPEGPNYAGWPLVYMESGRTIPSKWKAAFAREINRTDNLPYAENVREMTQRLGVRFSDGSTWLNPAPRLPKATRPDDVAGVAS